MAADAEPRFDLFFSYAHKDNARGQVRELRDAIVADFESFAGRPLKEFFDEDDIPSMAAWEKRIAKGLHDSRLFLAILSPNYFASLYCQREWEEYVRYEAMRQCLGEGVAPVYFVELPGLDGPGVDQNIAHWVDEFRKRQWRDIRPWHNAGRRALEDAHVAERLKVLRTEIKDRLSRADRAKQSPTNIYRHNPQFVGRVRELTLLREALNERGSVGVVGHTAGAAIPGATAVHGVGGMGKTELALAYAHAFAWDYPGGGWLARCEGIDDFDLVLRQFAEPLHVEFTEDEQKNLHLAGERILTELRRRDRSLLMLDNVTSPSVLGPDVLMRLPSQSQLHVIATTRLGPLQIAGSPHDHTFLAVDELQDGDALALIRAHQPGGRFASEIDEADGKHLVALLAGFTLAVETAAIYLGRQPAPGAIGAYVARLRRELLAESEAAAADQTVGVRHKEKLLERTLAVTFETLRAEQNHVLALAALLPPDQIVLSWLHAVIAWSFPDLRPTGDETLDARWREITDSLQSLRLFQTTDDAQIVRMHRLVQELLGNQASALESTLKAALIEHIRNRADEIHDSWVQPDNRWELKPLVAYGWHLLKESDRGFGLALAITSPLRELAVLPEIEALLRHAVDRAKQLYGENSNPYGTSLCNLATVLTDTDCLLESESLAREAARVLEGENGGASKNLAAALNCLGRILAASNRMEEAVDCFRRALTIVDPDQNSFHSSVASLIKNLADALNEMNHLAEAEMLYRRALAMYDRCFGSEHPALATAVNGLVSILYKTGRFLQAELPVRHALSIQEKCFGSDHVKVTPSLYNLLVLLRETGRVEEAEGVARRCLGILERSLAPDHSQLAPVLVGLADILRIRNCFEEAELMYRRAIAILEKCFTVEHPKVSTAVNNLAGLLRSMNRLQEAEFEYRRVLAIDDACYPPDNPEVAVHYHNFASLLEQTSRLNEAVEFRQRSLHILMKCSCATGREHPNLRMALVGYANLLSHLGLSNAEIHARLKALASPFT